MKLNDNAKPWITELQRSWKSDLRPCRRQRFATHQAAELTVVNPARENATVTRIIRVRQTCEK